MMRLVDAKMRPMRTTVNIHDDLLAEAKVRAARSHRPLGALIDDALRAEFSERSVAADHRRRVLLPTDGGSGLQPGVDLEDRDALADLLGDNSPPDAPG